MTDKNNDSGNNKELSDDQDKIEKDFFNSETETADNEINIDPSVFKTFKPKFRRNPYVALLVIPVSIFLLYLFYQDFIYGVKGIISNEPEKLGNIERALKAGKIQPNEFAQVKGSPLIQSLISVPKDSGKDGKFYLYYILQGTENKFLVKRLSDHAQFVGEIPNTHTGRILRINDISEGKRIRNYIKSDKTNRIDHDIFFRYPPSASKNNKKLEKLFTHNLRELDKPNPLFITDLDTKISPEPDYELDLKFVFPDEVIVSFNEKYEVTSEIEARGGTWKSKKCPLGEGGDLVIKKSEKVHNLPQPDLYSGKDFKPELNLKDQQAKKENKQLTCPDCKVSTENQKEDKNKFRKMNSTIIRIPTDAEVINLETEKPIVFKNNKFVISGGNCKNKPEQYELKLSYHPYKTIAGCYRWLLEKEYPFLEIKKEDITDYGNFEIVASIPDRDLEILKEENKIERDCKKDKTGKKTCKYIYPEIMVRSRIEYINKVKMRNIKKQGNQLILLRAKADYPRFYKKKLKSFTLYYPQKEKQIAAHILIPEEMKSNFMIDIKHLIKFKYYPPTEVSEDSYIMIGDQEPRSFGILWKIPIVLVLLGLIIFNTKSIVKKFIK
ncbi:MAG: hypothetical protein ACQES9_02765 [Myxococcota bacterium]